VSHAEWPKDKQEYAPTQIGGVICCPLKSVVIERAPPRTEGFSQCDKETMSGIWRSLELKP